MLMLSDNRISKKKQYRKKEKHQKIEKRKILNMIVLIISTEINKYERGNHYLQIQILLKQIKLQQLLLSITDF